MFAKRKVSALVSQYAADRGWHIVMCCQPQHLFRRDIDRRLPRVADPRDPWFVTIANDASLLAADNVQYGEGATADEAVLAAVPRGLRESLRLLELSIDNLRDCLQK